MAKMNPNGLSHMVCFSCGNIFPNEQKNPIACLSCGYEIKAEMYRKIMKHAMCAVYYGYDYRKVYEKQIANNSLITERYALVDPSTLLCFCAAAALSGIIGGIAYDCVKKAIKAIISNGNAIKQDIGQSRIYLFESHELNTFIRYIRQYSIDRDEIDSGVLKEIEDEEIGWAASSITTELIFRGVTLTEEEIREAIHDAIHDAKNPDRPIKDNFVRFWESLPATEEESNNA
jgi:DNA-directed RNA polymerase subunit RPC12/RpoP